MILHLLADEAKNLPFLQDYWSVVTDPAHIAAEATIEVISAGIGYLVGRKVWRRALSRHDAEVHGVHPKKHN